MRIFTDGSCLGNPGPGGWAALLVQGTEQRLLEGGEAQTTNNRMELMAAIQGLEAAPAGVALELTTDSRYVMDGIEKWIHGWKRSQWRTAAGKPVKNQDLWQRLDQARAGRTITWTWVKGHNGHPENERVDQAAQAQSRLAASPGRRRAP